jgi:uncharacterized phiE125 gp8 family phage protein
MILINGVPGRLVPCLSVHGIRPPDFAALGDAPSPLANDLPALANRADAQWLWVLLPSLLATGTVQTDDQGGFEVDDPADGTWTQQYRSLVMPLTGAAQVEVSTITLIVGGVTTVSLAGSGGGSAGGSGTLGVGKPLAGTGGGYAGGSGTLSVDALGVVDLHGQGGGTATGSGALTVQAADFLGLTAWPGVRNTPLRSRAEPVTIVAPAVEPISLLEARQHLKIDDTNVADDALITALIVAARQRAEHETGRRLITQVWDLVLDRFPPSSQAIELSSSLIQAQSIVQINYLDTAGVVRAVPLDAFALDAFTLPGYVIPRDGHAWPTDAAGTVNSVRVRVACGYGAQPTDVPMAIRQWILLQLGAMYENREAFVTGKSVAELPAGFVDRLLDPYRVWTL